jgi:hypothetical protein
MSPNRPQNERLRWTDVAGHYKHTAAERLVLAESSGEECWGGLALYKLELPGI